MRIGRTSDVFATAGIGVSDDWRSGGDDPAPTGTHANAKDERMSDSSHHEVIVLGAGVSGIYQIKRLVDLGIDAIVLEADEDLGGTWYRNRYPGCRFDSESYSYGYSFSRELLDEWHWKSASRPSPRTSATSGSSRTSSIFAATCVSTPASRP